MFFLVFSHHISRLSKSIRCYSSSQCILQKLFTDEFPFVLLFLNLCPIQPLNTELFFRFPVLHYHLYCSSISCGTLTLWGFYLNFQISIDMKQSRLISRTADSMSIVRCAINASNQVLFLSFFQDPYFLYVFNFLKHCAIYQNYAINTFIINCQSSHDYVAIPDAS